MTLADFIPGFIFPHENAYAAGHEGDPNYVVVENVPGDSGGLTKYGIDAASHPGVDISSLTAPEATAIYVAEYNAVEWALPGYAAALAQFPVAAALAFFDTREVCGLDAAWRITQQALGVTVDGVAGPETKAAVLAADPKALLAGIVVRRAAYHATLGASVDHDAQFVDGWENRCTDLMAYLS